MYDKYYRTFMWYGGVDGADTNIDVVLCKVKTLRIDTYHEC